MDSRRKRSKEEEGPARSAHSDHGRASRVVRAPRPKSSSRAGAKGHGRPKPKVQGRRSETPPKTGDGARSPLSKSELEPLVSELAWRHPAELPTPYPSRVTGRLLEILMVGWEWPPHHSGGLGVHSFELCKELTSMGHRVTFLTPFGGPKTEIPGVTFRSPGDSLTVEPYPGAYDMSGPAGRLDEPDVERYNNWIASLPIGSHDVIHVHDWFGTAGASRLSRRTGRPLVMTVHSTEYDRSLGHPWSEILHRERVGIDNADRVIAVSRHLKQQLVQRYHAPEEKVRVVYNAVRPSERLARLDGSRQIVLYLGRLAAMKGVDTFLRAAARVAPSQPNTLFVVAGEGPEFPRLLTLAAHLGVSDQVLFLGKVTEEERVALMAAATVFVLPSVVEPFGIVALEAMAAGVPVIVSKTSGVAEITNSIFTVDFWDIDEFASRISELLRYPTLRRAMGEAGRRSATREGWRERALQTVAVYYELVDGNRV
jgi:glycosyltransferase involved in cell wall biosynthesis